MFKIYIHRKPATLLCEVFIVAEPGPRQGDIGCFLEFKDGETVATRMMRGGSEWDVKPAFTIDERDLREVLAAFTEAAKYENIPDRTETYLKGKLEATEGHLEDMRSLVFKKHHDAHTRRKE